MKNKKLIILFLAFIFSSFLLISDAKAQQISGDGVNVFGDGGSMVDLKFKPNVPIPIRIGPYNFAQENTIKGGDFLAHYIVAIYQYGAGFAGIVAMFMLVIAGWKWLMAAGYPQKIVEAKQIFSSVLLGLLLLFGGQLLLTQISENFGYIKTLDIELSDEVIGAISQRQGEAETAYCTARENDADPNSDLKIKDCDDYESAEFCAADVCSLKSGSDNFGDHCYPKYNDNGFDKCEDCPGNCKCSDYRQAWVRRADPCDCDEDGNGGSIGVDPPGGEDSEGQDCQDI